MIKGFLLLVALGLMGCLSSSNPVRLNQTSYPPATNYKQLTINDLKQQHPTTGNYNVEGYIAKIYSCPPCLPNTDCKPCMNDNIVISTQPRQLNSYNLTEQDLIIFAHKVDQFTLGKKYRCSIKISENKSTSEALNDIDLVGYTAID